jgi:hypothetical protein
VLGYKRGTLPAMAGEILLCIMEIEYLATQTRAKVWSALSAMNRLTSLCERVGVEVPFKDDANAGRSAVKMVTTQSA